MPAPVLLMHPSSLEHDPGGWHPERSARMTAIARELAARDWLGWDRGLSPAAGDSLLEAVHPRAHLDALRAHVGPIDGDTAMSAGSWEAATHAAGGAARAVDLLLAGDASCAAALHRPPGHHAEAATAMGFCLLNSVAVAARRALDAHGAGRVLVLDWDVHHGNGTSDVFHATDEVLFVSVHESPLYPGTGPAGDTGSGRGEGFTVNLPVPGRSDDAVWASMVEHVVVPLALAYAPRLVLVSAGFDAHADDPLATCRVTEAGFAAMAGSVARLGAELGVPVGMVLEGGYALDALGRSVAATLDVLGAAQPPAAAPGLPVHPLAGQAARRLAGRWPTLAASA